MIIRQNYFIQLPERGIPSKKFTAGFVEQFSHEPKKRKSSNTDVRKKLGSSQGIVNCLPNDKQVTSIDHVKEVISARTTRYLNRK